MKKKLSITLSEELLEKLDALEGANTSAKIEQVLAEYFKGEVNSSELKLMSMEKGLITIKSALLGLSASLNARTFELPDKTRKWWEFWK